MITMKEANKIAQEKNEEVSTLVINEVLPKISEMIEKNANVGNFSCNYSFTGEESKWAKKIMEAIVDYGYDVQYCCDDDPFSMCEYLIIRWS